MSRLFFSLFLLAFTITGNAQTTFELAIVPQACGWLNQCSIETAEKDPHTFYVVLTNQSDKPQFIWETWNSWGYNSISFEVTTADGKIHVLTIKPQIFTRNFPSTYKIPPGEHQVFPIRLNDEWNDRLTYSKAGSESVKVKAIFEIKPSPEDSKNNAWTGLVSSQIYNLELRHW
jgi:hypothetical protein